MLTVAGTGCGQQPQWRFIGTIQDHNIPLGDTTITARLTVYNDTLFPFFLHLHHNEATADSTLHQYLGEQGGAVLMLLNNRQRNLSFTLSGKRFLADPNRIFTDSGTRQSLQLLSVYDSASASALKDFATQVLALIPNSIPLIAVHNNTDKAYSILSYTANGALAKDAALVYRNPSMDADDFVLTTHEGLFQYLKSNRINAVLQHNTLAGDDGSLSIVLGRKGHFYINIEAEHGHGKTQRALINQVAAFVRQHLSAME
ncbi:hypothetical protein BUE76_16870 [Cnuella takakiae]|nr:hypothetical protein BUE76_16870 [Cnuella takakiae]